MDETIRSLIENPAAAGDLDAETAAAARDALAAALENIAAGEQDDTAAAAAEAIAAALTALDDRIAALAADVDPDPETEPETEPETADAEPETEPETAAAASDRIAAALAATRRAPLADANAQRPRRTNPAPATSRATIVAAAGQDGPDDGFESAVALAEHFMGAHSRIAGGRVGGSFKTSLARISAPRPIALGDDPLANALAVRRLVNSLERRETDALTASGGVCAPAETVYGFFDISSEDGLWQLPGVNARRGRVQYPTSPSLETIFETTDWDAAVASEWTIANDENPSAPATKPYFQVPCPEFETYEVSAKVLRLRFGNFQAQFYPEMVADALGKSLVAHTHLVNAMLLADAVALAESRGPIPTDLGGSVSAIMHSAGFHATFYRERYRMNRNAPITVVFPHWVQEVLRTDWMARDGSNDPGIADAAIGAWFSARNLNPQFVYDWQGLTTAPEVQYPDTVDFLMYAEGTVIRLDAPTIDLGMYRDSTLTDTNDWEQFVETFSGLALVGHKIVKVEDVPVFPTGTVGVDTVASS